MSNKKFDGYSVYTNTVPGGALRGYGQPTFAVESAMTELALALDLDPMELRRRNVIRPGDALLAIGEHPDDVTFTEDGLRACIDLVDAALQRSANGHALGDEWLVGTGTASSIHETAPPTEHISEAWATLRDDGMYEIAVGTVEFGEGWTVTTAAGMAASTKIAAPLATRIPSRDASMSGRQHGPRQIGHRIAQNVQAAERQIPPPWLPPACYGLFDRATKGQ